MNINEVREEKERIENEIRKLLKDFQDLTDVNVESVKIDAMHHTSINGCTQNIITSVKLDLTL